MLQPERKFNAGGYRFGFNGKENDDEVKGNGNLQEYGMRIYDSRLERFLSVDPLIKKYPWYSPYQFAGNKPLWAVDLDGLEEYYATNGSLIGKIGTNTQVRVVADKELKTVEGYILWANGTKNNEYKTHATTKANQFSIDAGIVTNDLHSLLKLNRAALQNEETLTENKKKIILLKDGVKKLEQEFKIIKEQLTEASNGDVVNDGITLSIAFERLVTNKKVNEMNDKKTKIVDENSKMEIIIPFLKERIKKESKNDSPPIN